MINDDTIKQIEKLHQLKNDGVITEADFEAAKQRLLLGTKPTAAASASVARPTEPVAIPAETDLMGWIMLPLRRYADFTGRSRRKEFWLFQLLPVGLLFVSALFGLVIGTDAAFGLLLLCLLGLLVPQVAVQVRRFHDLGKPGTFALLNLIPYLGALIVLGFMLLPGEPGENQYGDDPLEPSA